MKKLIAGNWKMNGNLAKSSEIVAGIAEKIENYPAIRDICDFVICPPFPYLLHIEKLCKKSNIEVGAQNCSVHHSGAYTGDISADMIRDCGGSYVILGHSERRQHHNESDQHIAQKAKAAHDAGLKTIICVGETERQRDKGEEEIVVGQQLRASLPETATAENTAIAYEPVWAIGSGKTANPQDVETMHKFIRDTLKELVADPENLRILYGGSMKPENAAALLSTPNVDGGLIGGASLHAEQFVAIGLAAPQK